MKVSKTKRIAMGKGKCLTQELYTDNAHRSLGSRLCIAIRNNATESWAVIGLHSDGINIHLLDCPEGCGIANDVAIEQVSAVVFEKSIYEHMYKYMCIRRITLS